MLDPEREPTEKELREIERLVEEENFFDEQFDNFQIMEEDFEIGDEDF